MPEANDVIISWTIAVWSVLTVAYSYTGDNPEWSTEFQRYRNGEAITGETWNTYTIKITDQSCDIVCAVAPVDSQGNIWEIAYSNALTIQIYSTEIKPIEKQYIVKLYDANMDFVKVIPAGIITNDISFNETIDAGQWEVKLNLVLPIDTDYFDGVRYCKIYMNDNKGTTDLLIYSWRLSQVQRQYSNQKENITAVFLSLRSLLDTVILRDWTDPTFSKTGDPANTIKFIIDYFNTIYPWILSYTAESIDDYWSSVTIQFDWISCQKALKNLVNWLSFYLYIWADGVVQYHDTPNSATHLLTYERNINALTIPENNEEIINVVQVLYEINGEKYETSIATDPTSIWLYGQREILLNRADLPDQTSAELYRDNYLTENKDMKRNISITVNTLYDIETIHPWQTVKITNLWLNIENAQIQNVKYTYEQATLTLEYYTNIGDQIFNS